MIISSHKSKFMERFSRGRCFVLGQLGSDKRREARSFIIHTFDVGQNGNIH
jgi:hypothetical protein